MAATMLERFDMKILKFLLRTLVRMPHRTINYGGFPFTRATVAGVTEGMRNNA
jgi:hypothetical protein